MKLKSYLFLAGMSFSALTFAQQHYNVQTLQETYTELQNPTVITSGQVWDDIEIAVDVPFSFTVNGNEIDSVYVTEGGLISAGILSGTSAGSLFAVVASNADHVDVGEHTFGPAASPVSYEVLTENGKQILALQFKNVGFYDEMTMDSTYVDSTNFQIRLVDDNSVEIHYGLSHVSQAEDYFENELGNVVAFMPSFESSDTSLVPNADIYILEGNPTSPTVTTVSNPDLIEDNAYGFNSYPENGRKYIFSPDNQNVGLGELDNANISLINPINKTLVFSSSANVDRIEIINAQGKLVLNTNIVQDLDVSELNQGMYFVKFYNENNTLGTKKMIKL